MKNHLLEKLHKNLNIFKILKNLTEKKIRGFQDLEAKNSKNFKLTSGAPYARCATSNRKKIGFENKNLIFFQNMIGDMTGKFEIFFQNFIILMNMNKVLDINKV